MLGRRRSKDAGASAAGEGFEEEALDTLAAVLRALGDLAFPVGELSEAELREGFEGWARHVLVGAPPPDVEERSDDSSRRDFGGLRRFVAEKRREEREYVVGTIAGLRETVWLFVQGIGRALPEDRRADEAIGEQLVRLRSSLDANDADAVRRDAISAVGVIEQVIEERRDRDRRRLESLAAEADRYADELVQAREQLEIDALTGVYNRAALDETLERMVHLLAVSGRASTLFMVDVDDFKWVNDHFGHAAGDAVLGAVAELLGVSFRRNGFVARYGGDEFAVIAQTADAEGDLELAEDAVLRARDLAVPSGDEPVRVSLSIGSARLVPGESLESWMARADAALYAAKGAGKDCYRGASE